MTGPVQVLVVGFDEASFSGEVLEEFARLAEGSAEGGAQGGTVRLLDVLLLRRAEDGSLETLAPPPGTDPAVGQVTAALLGRRDDDSSGQGDLGDALWSLDDAIPPDGVVAVALLEHVWAQPVVAAIRRAGGRPLDETWLAADDVALLERLLEDDAGR